MAKDVSNTNDWLLSGVLDDLDFGDGIISGANTAGARTLSGSDGGGAMQAFTENAQAATPMQTVAPVMNMGLAPMVQPLVVVPFHSTDMSLVYGNRYSAPRRPAVREELASEPTADEEVRSASTGKVKNRILALISLLLTVGVAVLLVLKPLIAGTLIGVADGAVNMTVAEALVVLIRDAINRIFSTELVFLGNNAYVSHIRTADNVLGVVLPLGLLFTAVSLILCAVRFVTRLITGNARRKGIALAVVTLVSMVILLVGIVLFDTASFMDNLLSVAAIGIAVGACVIFILSFLFVPNSVGKAKRDKIEDTNLRRSENG